MSQKWCFYMSQKIFFSDCFDRNFFFVSVVPLHGLSIRLSVILESPYSTHL